MDRDTAEQIAELYAERARLSPLGLADVLAPFDGGTIYVADAIRAPLYSLTGGALYRIRVEEGAGEARATFVVDRFALDDLELRMIAAFSSSEPEPRRSGWELRDGNGALLLTLEPTGDDEDCRPSLEDAFGAAVAAALGWPARATVSQPVIARV